jgi:hypothetical protein
MASSEGRGRSTLPSFFCGQQKRIFLVALLLCMFCVHCTHQKQDKTERARRIITQNYYLYEPNPLYSAEADELNNLFRNTLVNRNALSVEEKKRIYEKVTTYFNNEDESGPVIEDSVDENRQMMTEILCLGIAALVSEPEKAEKLFHQAQAFGGDNNSAAAAEIIHASLTTLKALYLADHRRLTTSERDQAKATIGGFTHLPAKSRNEFIAAIADLP